MEFKSQLMNTYSNNYNVPASKVNQPIRNSSDVAMLKQVFPQYLYNPPYGYPKRLNHVFLRRIAQNLHVSSILKTIKDGIVLTDWDIVPDKGIELTKEEQVELERCRDLFKNPNPEDTYKSWIKKWIEDLIVLESGCYTHVLNRKGDITQLRAVDGSSILKNPDVFGSFENRENIIDDYAYFIQDVEKDWKVAQSVYGTTYNVKAAYFQYNGAFAYGFPTPYGKDEIVYMQSNPESSGVYTNGSPISDSVDVILALVMGVKYHLDFYLNGNTPEGIINLAGGTDRDVENVKHQLSNSITTIEEQTGFQRKMGYVMPITTADDIEFKPLTFNSKDMEILGQQTLLQKLIWQRFGLTADEMGDVMNSNRATTDKQTNNAIRKAILPYLMEIQENFNKFTIKKFFKGRFKFKYILDNTPQEHEKYDLYEKKIRIGVETWQTIAEKENIDIVKLKKHKDENREYELQQTNNHEENIKDYEKTNNLKSSVPNKLNLDKIIDEIETDIEKELKLIQNEK